MYLKVKETRYNNFRDFADDFERKNKTKNMAYKKKVMNGDMTDEEAIVKYLDQKVGFFHLTFIDDERDGYFLVFELEGDYVRNF
jgi:hypothetical protein